MIHPNYAPSMAALVVGLLTPAQLRELVRWAGLVAR